MGEVGKEAGEVKVDGVLKDLEGHTGDFGQYYWFIGSCRKISGRVQSGF